MNIESKVNFITKVLQSCETYGQLKNAYKWAERVLDFHCFNADQITIEELNRAVNKQMEKLPREFDDL